MVDRRTQQGAHSVTALPSGWRHSTLKDICLPITKSDPAELGRENIRYIDIGSVDGSRHAIVQAPEIHAVGAPSRCRQIVQAGDTVFSTVRPYLEKIAYVDEALDGQFASTGFCVLRPGPRLLPRYLHYFSISHTMLDQVLPFQKGVSYPAVLDREVRATTIPVPPLDEQRRIVDLLENHLSRLDAANAGLVSSARRLVALKRSLLAELHAGPSLSLAELAWDSGYGTSEKCLADGPGVPVVRIPNLVNGLIDLTDQKRVADPAADVSGSMLSDGDLLIVRTNGSVDLIGRSAVVQPGIDAAFASYLIRYRLRDLVRPAWAQAMLSTPQVRRRIEPLAASSAGQHNLSLSKLNPLQLPVPSVAQQDAALARLRDIDARICSLRSDIQRGRSQSAALRRSLLVAAFSGRLAGAGDACRGDRWDQGRERRADQAGKAGHRMWQHP
jgi:type I restriction enzyme S subunit